MIETIVAALLGLLIGSFLNVCIYRWPQNLSVVRPRSHCARCHETIAWYDNIPILSYALLGGKCRRCHAPISMRYPIVELLTAAAFAYFWWNANTLFAGVKACVFAAMLIGLVFCDLEARILPDEITLGGIVAGLAFAYMTPMPRQIEPIVASLAGTEISGSVASLLEAAAGAVVPAGFLWLFGWLYSKVRRREGLGFGDVKLMAMIGAFLGLGGSLLALFVGSIAGSVIGYAYIKIRGEDASTYELPFGAFLGAAALVMAAVGKG